MIAFDYVDKSNVKDIIAAQQVQRRSKPSLLSTAQKYRILPENSFITGQHLPRRKKKRSLEKIRLKLQRDSLNTIRPLIEPVQKQKPSQESPFVSLRAAGNWLAGLPKQYFLSILVGFATLCLLFIIVIGYIPDPEPPEDMLIREHGERTVFSLDEGDEIPLDLTETFAWQSYTVRSGDSVEAIARSFDLSLDAVIASNNLRNVRHLRAGETIRIPNMDGIPHVVKGGDSYTKIAASHGVPLEAILDANDIQNNSINAGTVLFIPGAKMDKNDLRRALGEFFIWPISGRRSSGFGWRNDPFTGVRSFHAGLDISAPVGTAVKASAEGRVSATGFNAVYGYFLILSHADDYQTMYAHLSKILVKNGAYVTQGAIIAQSGNTGRSTGPHLHLSVYKNKRAINPLEILNR
ncbi:MAG: M23 family metallopeptidase [Treponema sp.]|nr:M23 family metallopeptidase [Treponema sp.]